MKRVILLHTVQCMYLTFEQRIRNALDCEVKIDNILDTFFASNSNELGEFTKTNLNRLYLTLKSAEMTGADLIAVICSTLSPHVKQIAPFLSIPVLTIDEKLGTEAIKHGNRIMILASARSAIGPTEILIRDAAKEVGKDVLIDAQYNMTAFQAMMHGDMDTHNKEIVSMAQKVKNKDVIVFAQGSMEHMADTVMKVTGMPVVTAPALCIEQIKKYIQGGIE